MSRLLTNINGRARAALVAIVAGLILAALLPAVAGSRAPIREITLVARDMSFYLDGTAAGNPAIKVKAGERIRVTLRNEDAGTLHNFAVQALGVAIEPFKGEAQRSVEFRVPPRAGRYEYLCMPHARMMRGVLDVVK